jgi:hypothetical protein
MSIRSRDVTRAVVLLVALLTAGTLLVACGSSAATVVTYDRDWPDGYHEELTLMDDGRVFMHHGDTLEHLTISAADVQRIRDGLAAGITEGDQGDTLVRSIVLANGTKHSPVKVVPGSVVELLERLLTTHSLTGSPPPAQSIAPVHSLGAHASP